MGAHILALTLKHAKRKMVSSTKTNALFVQNMKNIGEVHVNQIVMIIHISKMEAVTVNLVMYLKVINVFQNVIMSGKSTVELNVFVNKDVVDIMESASIVPKIPTLITNIVNARKVVMNGMIKDGRASQNAITNGKHIIMANASAKIIQ